MPNIPSLTNLYALWLPEDDSYLALANGKEEALLLFSCQEAEDRARKDFHLSYGFPMQLATEESIIGLFTDMDRQGKLILIDAHLENNKMEAIRLFCDTVPTTVN